MWNIFNPSTVKERLDFWQFSTRVRDLSVDVNNGENTEITLPWAIFYSLMAIIIWRDGIVNGRGEINISLLGALQCPGELCLSWPSKSSCVHIGLFFSWMVDLLTIHTGDYGNQYIYLEIMSTQKCHSSSWCFRHPGPAGVIRRPRNKNLSGLVTRLIITGEEKKFFGC